MLLIAGFGGARDVFLAGNHTQSNWKACLVSTREPRYMQQSRVCLLARIVAQLEISINSGIRSFRVILNMA